MSGGAEQADILSVLSLVKERWKVVSDVAIRRQWAVCLSSPVPACPQLILCPTNSDSLLVKQSFLVPVSPSALPLKHLTCGLDSLGSCLSVQVGLLQYGGSKNSPYGYLWQCSVL